MRSPAVDLVPPPPPMPATNLTLPHPPLVATLARGEAVAWVEQFGMPGTDGDLAAFAEHIACLTAVAIHDGARRRMGERRATIEREA